jgi:Na+/proline symporter
LKTAAGATVEKADVKWDSPSACLLLPRWLLSFLAAPIFLPTSVHWPVEKRRPPRLISARFIAFLIHLFLS